MGRREWRPPPGTVEERLSFLEREVEALRENEARYQDLWEDLFQDAAYRRRRRIDDSSRFRKWRVRLAVLAAGLVVASSAVALVAQLLHAFH